jgi:hypothetical protein
MIGINFKTRRISRAAWKAIWRQLRIVNRETRMAEADLVLFGTSFIYVGADVPDFIRRVPPQDIIIRPDGVAELRP